MGRGNSHRNVHRSALMPERLLYPYDEARAQLGGIGKTQFQELLSSGRIRRTRIGRRAFVHRDELIRFIASLAGERDGA